MTLNLQKELRTLTFPAGLILAAVLAGAWATAGPGPMGGYRGAFFRGALIAFFLGTPLLASLPFGSEFQHKTIVLLLSQPVSRTRVWFEKWIAAVAVLAVLSGLAFTFVVLRAPEGEWPIIPALRFIVMAACSAPLWTLVARSTIGGLTFTMSVIMVLELGGTYLLYRVTGTRLDQEVFGRAPLLDIARALYAAATLYAGWMMFSRFQAVATGIGSASGGYGGLAFLRARRDDAMENLLRKEVMLQRPTFLVAGAFVACWMVAVAGVSMRALSVPAADIVFPLLLGSYVPLVVVLAGTISAGEEASLGIKAWHMTLPVSARTQWTLKAAVALVVGLVLALLLPALMTAVARVVADGALGMRGMPFLRPTFVLTIAAGIVLAFWAATLLADTVKAAVATGGAVLAIGLTISIGNSWGSSAGRKMPWLASLVSPLHLSPRFASGAMGIAVIAVLGIVCVAALRQSYRAYRTVRVPGGSAIRMALVLLAIAFVGAFCLGAFESALWKAITLR